MKRTDALAIPRKVKEAVAERDSVDGWPCCIWCGRPAPAENRLAFSCCHVLRRSRGGRGIETNIVTLCPADHALFDNGDKEREALIFSYMKEQYGPDWNLNDQRYRKGEE